MNTDDAVIPAVGYIYVAPPDTLMPPLASIIDPATPDGWGSGQWDSIGNTSLDNGISHAVDGDDPETKGSWQKPNLRLTNPKKTYSLDIKLEDFTVESYRLYYGSSRSADPDGTFVIPESPVAQARALLIIAVDADHMVAEYYPRVTIIGNGAIEYDPANLTEIPVRATVLTGNTADTAYPGKITPRIPIPKPVTPPAPSAPPDVRVWGSGPTYWCAWAPPTTGGSPDGYTLYAYPAASRGDPNSYTRIDVASLIDSDDHPDPPSDLASGWICPSEAISFPDSGDWGLAVTAHNTGGTSTHALTDTSEHITVPA
ncbi:hypothetical protein [Haloglycomyces albus]|uniref:phage tail tube protein n=1 Tax=Haloglycomyces albus TaxID=526067 RepID=UPI00046D3E7D|nr:hypothetical protein [Haloglycomyces albus]